MDQIELSPLGQKVIYESEYNPGLLYPISRLKHRRDLGIENDLPFTGVDIWNAYEISWLNSKGKPQIAVAEITYACKSEAIIESKSLKLYFNSLNNTKFDSADTVLDIIQKDLSEILQTIVKVIFLDIDENLVISSPNGLCIDHHDIEIDNFNLEPSILKVSTQIVQENLYSNLLKSNCLITSQPDWATIFIEYQGNQIDQRALLEYLISFRNHNEFHEQCIERIFNDINNYCKPNWLTIYARYTRRGGIDINPFRTNNPNYQLPLNFRLIRQ